MTGDKDEDKDKPPRISRAYLLGLSNKPFKEEKAPRPPPVPTPFNRPGAVIEWVASDGRKGLTSGHHNRLSVPKDSGEKLSNMGKKVHPSPAKKSAPPGTPSKSLHATPNPGDLMGGLFAAFGEGNPTPAKTASVAVAPQAPAAAAAAATDNTSGFTKEQDDELLRRKTEGETWAEIVTAMGKDKGELTRRFGQIKPAGWKPNQIDKGKNKGKKKGDQEQKKEEEKPKEPTQPAGNNGWAIPINDGNQGANAGNINAWAANIPNNPAMSQYYNPNPNPNPGFTWGAPAVAPQATAPQATAPQATDHHTMFPQTVAQPAGNLIEQKQREANANNGNNGTTGGANPNVVPVHFFNDVYPDETFSVEDLARISKILKRDHEQVWFRLSCAFRDKTGRHIHPDVFKEKLLGKEYKKKKKIGGG